MPSIYSTILGLISYTPPSFTPLIEPSEGFALRVYMVVGFRHGRALVLCVPLKLHSCLDVIPSVPAFITLNPKPLVLARAPFGL